MLKTQGKPWHLSCMLKQGRLKKWRVGKWNNWRKCREWTCQPDSMMDAMVERARREKEKQKREICETVMCLWERERVCVFVWGGSGCRVVSCNVCPYNNLVTRLANFAKKIKIKILSLLFIYRNLYIIYIFLFSE